MTAVDLRDSIARVMRVLRETYPLTGERAEIASRLAAIDSALANPASLCTRDELFDAIVCADCDAETEGPSLLDDLLEQISTPALVAAASARLAEETERSRRVREDLELDTHPPDPSEGP